MSLSALRKDTAFAAGLLKKKPFQCLVQLTNRCNMRCSFCDFWPNGVPRRDELSTDDYRRLARELSGVGTFIVSIEGGEPFVRPDLMDIVEAFGRDHLPTLFTNGWYVTRDSARELFARGVSVVAVSVDYPDAARHDAKRGLDGAFARAIRAVELLREAAPRGDRQVQVMSVLMGDNWRDFEALFEMSKRLGVGHQVTLLSVTGFRRGKQGDDRMPPPEAGERLSELWERHKHVRFFGDYFRTMGAFLGGGAMPTCRAGMQSFNVDHVGNVSPCIEKIDLAVGNVRREPLGVILGRMADHQASIGSCQRCWTACRGLAQALGEGGAPGAWVDLATRLKSS